ncbi:MAG: hypothetical protein Q7R76_05165 [Candidatus Woesearchaeota archaeon]|nr:hypothetical protein [Candidatus Woesearchaeota archaeon]
MNNFHREGRVRQVSFVFASLLLAFVPNGVIAPVFALIALFCRELIEKHLYKKLFIL